MLQGFKGSDVLLPQEQYATCPSLLSVFLPGGWFSMWCQGSDSDRVPHSEAVVGSPWPAAHPAEGCREIPAPPCPPHGLRGSLCSSTQSCSSSDLRSHRAVYHIFYLTSYSCEMFCPFLNLLPWQCLHGEPDCALLWGCCGTGCGWGSPDVSSQRPPCSSPLPPPWHLHPIRTVVLCLWSKKPPGPSAVTLVCSTHVGVGQSLGSGLSQMQQLEYVTWSSCCACRVTPWHAVGMVRVCVSS